LVTWIMLAVIKWCFDGNITLPQRCHKTLKNCAKLGPKTCPQNLCQHVVKSALSLPTVELRKILISARGSSYWSARSSAHTLL
jgi:hypothetical protein